jgi:hypothetical protein
MIEHDHSDQIPAFLLRSSHSGGNSSKAHSRAALRPGAGACLWIRQSHAKSTAGIACVPMREARMVLDIRRRVATICVVRIALSARGRARRILRRRPRSVTHGILLKVESKRLALAVTLSPNAKPRGRHHCEVDVAANGRRFQRQDQQ